MSYVINKQLVFSEELKLIDDRLLPVAKDLIDGLPDYFFFIPASSTGKYHPEYALGVGGLIRHTKSAIAIAKSLMDLENYVDAKEKQSEIVIALILHDGFKQGISESGRTVSDHPLQSAKYVECYLNDHSDLDQDIKDSLILIKDLIESHMGQWNRDWNGNEIMPYPRNRLEFFVHLCDYIASRRFLEFNSKEV